MAPTIRIRYLAATSLLASVFAVYREPKYSVKGSVVLSFLSFFSVAFSGYLVWRIILWPKLFSPLLKLPVAPGGTFFGGHSAQVLKDPTGIPMRRWINSVPNEGLIRYNFYLNTERVFLTSPKALAEVLVTKNYDFPKPDEARHALGRLLGFGILLAEGDEHKQQRKDLMPAFQYRHVKDLYPTFWGKSAEMLKVVSKIVKEDKNKDQNGGSVVDFADWLSRCTLDIIGIAGMGYNFNAIHDPNSELNHSYRNVFTPNRQAQILALLGQFVPIPVLRRLPLKRNDDIASAAAIIRGTSRRLIQEKMRKLAETEKQEAVGKDILSVALASGGFTVENLVDQTMTFLAAGHETTATATQWALVTLSQHPDMQTRLREEIREVLPSLDEDTPMTAELMDSLPYLHAVCSEVLRFHAPVPFTRREAARDTTILGQFVPKGTSIALVPSAINFSKELWGEDAEEFKPDRWLGEKRKNNGGAESNYANMTFLHGPRSCIGLQFAKSEFHCLLAAVIGRFEVELEPKDKEIGVETGIVARPKGGLKLRMRVVDGW